MNIGAHLTEKTAVIRMTGSVDKLIASSIDTLEALKKKRTSLGRGHHYC
jgi:hypothetical protein